MADYDVTGTGAELRRKLEALTYEQLVEEYKYRLRVNPPRRMPPEDACEYMIQKIVWYVADTGDGPEALKDMLRF